MKREAEKHLATEIAALMQSTGHNLNATASRAKRSAFIHAVITAWNQAAEIDETPTRRASKPKRPVNETVNNPRGEWESYTPTIRRAGARSYHEARAAVFHFADGLEIKAPLRHHGKRDRPDWERASRMAVHFWRARRAWQIRNLAGLEEWRPAEFYVRECCVPAIQRAYDLTRQVAADAEQATVATAELRQGAHQYLADVLDSAVLLGGDWELAAHGVLLGYDPADSGFKPGERIAAE